MKRVLQDPRGSFLLIVLVALALRLTALLELSDSVFHEVLVGDAALYDRWARGIAAGRGLDEAVLFQSPLYPFFLGGVYRVFGAGSGAIFWIQACAGALAVGLAFLTSRALFGNIAAWFTGVFAALYAPSIWYDGLLHKTSLAFLLGSLLLFLCVRRRAARGSPVATGLTLGLLGLLRPNALLLTPLVLLWTAIAGEPRIKRGLAFVAALLLPLAFLGFRNLSHGGTFLPVAGNAGVNFFQGNGAQADGLYRPLVAGRAHPDFERIDAETLAETERGRQLTQREVDRYWFGRAFRDIGDDPLRWFRLLGRKSRLAFQAEEVMDALAIEAFRESSRVLKWTGSIAWFGSLAPLAALGLWNTRKRWRGFWILPSGLAVLAASIVLFLVVGRLRMGLVPFLLPFAGAGALCLFCLPSASTSKRISSLACLLAASLLVHWSSPIPGDPLATTYSNLSSAFLQEGRNHEALRAGQRAVDQDDASGEAHFNLAAALNRAERFEEAVIHFENAAALEPSLAADAHTRIGLLLAREGRMEEARQAFRKAIEHDPQRASSHFNLGLAERRLGRLEAAATSYASAIALDPKAFDAHHNLGLLFEAQGSYARARDHYQDAVRAEPNFLASHLRLAWLSAVCSEPAIHSPALAVRSAEKAASLSSFDCEIADTLAAAYAADGRFDQARAVVERAAEQARAAGAERVVRLMEQRALRYGGEERLREEPDGTLPAPCVP